MSVQIQDNEKAAREALRRLYLIGLEASLASRMVEIRRLTETRIAAQVTAQSVYDDTIRQADADLEATVGAAKAVYDAAFNPHGRRAQALLASLRVNSRGLEFERCSYVWTPFFLFCI